MSSGRIGGPKWMRTGLGNGSSRDLGQASKVPAIPAGTTGTPARDTRTAMPDLSGASLPSRLRVPSGKSVTIPPRRNRRRVSFIPDAPIPSRWIGNAPTERIKNPRTGKKRLDRATKLSGRRDANSQENDVEEAKMVGDQEDGPGCRHVVPARGTPAPQRREQGCKHVLHEPVPEQFAPPAIGASAGAGADASTSRPSGSTCGLAGRCRRGLGSHWFAHGRRGSGKGAEKGARCSSKGKSLLVRRGDAFDKLLDHLVDGHAAGVDQHGVFGRFHGGDGAGDVAGVTNAQVLEHRLEAEGLAGCL